MDKTKLFEAVNAKAGQITTIVYKRPVKVKKKGPLANSKVEKISMFLVRTGLEYNNQKVVQEGHESGEIQKLGLPDYMEKLSRVHYRNKNNGKDFIGVTPYNVKGKPQTVWVVDGEIKELEDIKEHIYASEYGERDSRKWMYLDIERVYFITNVTNRLAELESEFVIVGVQLKMLDLVGDSRELALA